MRPVMSPKSPSVAVLLLGCLLSNVGTETFAADKQERHFSAGQVFNYQEPILFESDFRTRGLDKWNLSEDGRYRLPQNNPTRLQITHAPAMTGGAKAVRFTVPRAPNSYRSEIALPSERGFNERWYGILLYVPKDWEFDPNEGADILIQWHAVPGNWRPTNPNLIIAVQHSNWIVRQHFGSPQESPGRRSLKLGAPLRQGPGFPGSSTQDGRLETRGWFASGTMVRLSWT